jgi:hypothetical protein
LKKSCGYPINVYREECADGSTDLQEQAVALPRDVIQVRNFSKNEKRKMAITQGTNYNLQEITDDTQFIREIISQIEILFPIEPQRRTNGTSGTGSSIKHLKAVPFKRKKEPKREKFHSPM